MPERLFLPLVGATFGLMTFAATGIAAYLVMTEVQAARQHEARIAVSQPAVLAQGEMTITR